MPFPTPIFSPPPPSATEYRAGHRRRSYAAGGLSALGLVLLGPALSAQAHVHVHPDSTVAGSDTELAFSVPSESPSASTTILSITLPQDHPFAEVSARATPGWTAKITTAPLPEPVALEGTMLTKAAHVVTWTATPGFAIPPEQYQDFYLSVGPLPGSGDMVFTAKQTYSDGSVVSWDQQTAAGAGEPEHPAPSFTVTPAADTATAEATEADPGSEAASSTDSFSRWVGGAGLLAGLGAIGLMVARRSPRRTPAQTVENNTSGDTPDEDRTRDVSAAGTGRPSV